MNHKLSLNLKLARRQSGLAQADCAHLLGVDASRMSLLESGKSGPSAVELAALCVLFDRPADDFTKGAIIALRKHLAVRLASMPACPQQWRDEQRRTQTLQALSARLQALNARYDA